MEVLELLSELKVLDLLVAVSAIFIMVLGTIYTLGRMLGIVHYWRIKNILATLGCFGYSHLYIITFFPTRVGNRYLYNLLLHALSTSVLYVLLGFRLFDRVDSFLDKRFGKDNDFNPDGSKPRKVKKRQAKRKKVVKK